MIPGGSDGTPLHRFSSLLRIFCKYLLVLKTMHSHDAVDGEQLEYHRVHFCGNLYVDCWLNRWWMGLLLLVENTDFLAAHSPH